MYRLLSRIRFPPEPPPNSFRLAKLIQKPYTFEELPPQAVFTATEDLSVGPYRWSQVHRGSLQSVPTKHDGASHTSMQDSEEVILKVFKESLFPESIFYRSRRLARERGVSPWWNEATEEHMCWSEVFAYSALASLQGKMIPKFIDAYMAYSDEECMAIAMSRIEGRPIEEVCHELGADEDPDEKKWYPIAVQMLRNVHLLRQHGIVQKDIRTTNILVEETHGIAQQDSQESPSKYSVNLIDFARIEPYEYKIGDDGCAVLGGEIDVAQMEIMIARWCGNEVDHPAGYDLGGPTRRRSEFFKWLFKNYGDEQFVKDYWVSLKRCVHEKYFVCIAEGPNFRP
ncbi:hypothetical protein D9613_010946 [Agrocybe pediades]|uniref:Protein kinase domain-containing protein n=1 Tax=Agrocybe pediades TaxID=84607 RepID=A0A8H4QLF5_9AGAR|nr:hypothetical protein D9613_010946 [Agrocybe pediades]